MPYKDKLKQKAALHKSYKKHKETVAERARRRRAIWTSWFTQIKKKFCCILCGEDRTPCLDLHHVNSLEKDDTVSQLVKDMSYTKAVEEMKKCVPVCSNCHRLIHTNELRVLPSHKKMFDIVLETVLKEIPRPVTKKNFIPN